MSDKILTRHPDSEKKGVNIDREKYDLVKSGIISVLSEVEHMKPMAMFHIVAERLKGQMEGSIQWYAVTVKLDMEARGELVHDRNKSALWLAKAP